MKKVRIMTDYAGCSYITPGKVYEVEISTETDQCMFGYAKLDNSVRGYLAVKSPDGCAYIGKNHWTILPDEPAEPQVDHAEELAKALEIAIPELTQTLEDLGPCDHGVGVCFCDLRSTIEVCKSTLTNYRSAKK